METPGMATSGCKRPLEDGAESEQEQQRPKTEAAASKTIQTLDSPIDACPATHEQALAAVGLGSPDCTRLEVLWKLELGTEVERRFWGATLDRAGAGTAAEEIEGGTHLFTLTYDPYGDFETCTRKVAFQVRARGKSLKA
jgi:hypothetical protein